MTPWYLALSIALNILFISVLLWSEKQHQDDMDTLRDWLTRCPDCGRVMDCICEECDKDDA